MYITEAVIYKPKPRQPMHKTKAEAANAQCSMRLSVRSLGLMQEPLGPTELFSRTTCRLHQLPPILNFMVRTQCMSDVTRVCCYPMFVTNGLYYFEALKIKNLDINYTS